MRWIVSKAWMGTEVSLRFATLLKAVPKGVEDKDLFRILCWWWLWYPKRAFFLWCCQIPRATKPHQYSTVSFCDGQWSRLLWVLAFLVPTLHPCLGAQGCRTAERQDLMFFHQRNPTFSRAPGQSAMVLATCAGTSVLHFAWNSCTQKDYTESTILGEQESDLLRDPSVPTKCDQRGGWKFSLSDIFLKVCFVSLSTSYFGVLPVLTRFWFRCFLPAVS